MFDVEHEDDAWELGVLFVNDFVDGSGPCLLYTSPSPPRPY